MAARDARLVLAWDGPRLSIGGRQDDDWAHQDDARRFVYSPRPERAVGRVGARRPQGEVRAAVAEAVEDRDLQNVLCDELLALPDDCRHLAYLFASTGNPLYQLRLAGVACPTPDSFLPVNGPRPKRYFSK